MTYSAAKCTELQNQAGTGVSDWHKIDTSETWFVPGDDLPKENAATLAKVNGARTNAKRDISPENNTPKSPSNAMSLYAKDGHKSIVTAISFALTLGTAKAWEGLSLILMARLTKAERAALAYSALISLDDDTAYRTASVALFGVMDGEALA